MAIAVLAVIIVRASAIGTAGRADLAAFLTVIIFVFTELADECGGHNANLAALVLTEFAKVRGGYNTNFAALVLAKFAFKAGGGGVIGQ